MWILVRVETGATGFYPGFGRSWAVQGFMRWRDMLMLYMNVSPFCGTGGIVLKKRGNGINSGMMLGAVGCLFPQERVLGV